MDTRYYIPTGKYPFKVNNDTIRTNSMDFAQVSLVLTLNKH